MDMKNSLEINGGNGVTDGARTRDNQNHNLDLSPNENKSLPDLFRKFAGFPAHWNQGVARTGGAIFGSILLLLATPLQAAELKSTFVFSTPYVDARGTVDKGDDIKYQSITFWTPLKPGEVFDVRARIESYSGDIRVLSYPLAGVCDNLGKALSCHLGNEFVGFTTVIRLDGKDTWGEINATRGMFGTDYNVMGLRKSEVVE